MIALPWLYLVLLSIGYGLALTYGQLGALAAVSVAMLLIAGYAVRQQRSPWARYLGHGLLDRKSTRLNSSHTDSSRMPSSA